MPKGRYIPGRTLTRVGRVRPRSIPPVGGAVKARVRAASLRQAKATTSTLKRQLALVRQHHSNCEQQLRNIGHQVGRTTYGKVRECALKTVAHVLEKGLEFAGLAVLTAG